MKGSHDHDVVAEDLIMYFVITNGQATNLDMLKAFQPRPDPRIIKKLCRGTNER